jgi:phosphoglycolate phosphatase
MTSSLSSTSAKLWESIRSAQALGFDFDGTLVDSNAIKRGAFDICFSEFPEHHKAIQEYCSRFNHTPRWEKFQHVVETLLKQSYTEERAKELHRRYEEATTKQVIAAPEIPGAMAFLAALPAGPKVLLSSTPDAILRDILNARRMTSIFNTIQGAPVSKSTWLTHYQTTHQLDKARLLFFGDTLEDASAAKGAGWPFVAVANPQIREGAEFYLEDYRNLGI